MCKVAQDQAVQESQEAECTLRNHDVLDETVPSSPPPSPLDSMIIESDHSPPSASIHTPSPSTRLSIQTWREGGDERRRRRWKKEEEEEFSVASLNYDANGMTPVSYKKFSSVCRGSPLVEQR